MKEHSTLSELDFLESLHAATQEALTSRQQRIFELYLGLSYSDPHSLREVGKIVGLSGERVRQIIAQCYRRIKSRANRECKAGKTEAPCAALISHLQSEIGMDEESQIAALAQVAMNKKSALAMNDKTLKAALFLLRPAKDARRIMKRTRRQWESTASLEELAETGQLLYRQFAQISWPRRVVQVSGDFIGSLARTREPSTEPRSYLGQMSPRAGSFYSDRFSREVLFESRMEEYFLKQLDSSAQVMAYQEQPLVIHTPGPKGGLTYHPDVLVVLSDRRGFLVEIKPQFVMPLAANIVKYRILWGFCRENGLGMLVTDGRVDISQLKRHNPPAEFVQSILDDLNKANIDWPRYRRIAAQHEVGIDDFLAMVLRHNLNWSLGPFRLVKG